MVLLSEAFDQAPGRATIPIFDLAGVVALSKQLAQTTIPKLFELSRTTVVPDQLRVINMALSKQLAQTTIPKLFGRGPAFIDAEQVRELAKLVASSLLAVETQNDIGLLGFRTLVDQLNAVGNAVADQLAASPTGVLPDVQRASDVVLDNEWPTLSPIEQLVILKFVFVMTFLLCTLAYVRFRDILDPLSVIFGVGAWPIARAAERTIAKGLDRLPPDR